MSLNHDQAYESLCSWVRETAILESIEALLGWDERTMMPPRAGTYRADQISYLAGKIHERRTTEQMGEWLEVLKDSPLAADPATDTAATITMLDRDYRKHCKLPQRLVEELAKTATLGQQTWSEARKNNDFATFQPLLERMYELKREQAQAIGYQDCMYDALLDDFEPDAKTAEVTSVLAALREDLVPFVAQIAEARRRPQADILTQTFPVEAQEAFGKHVSAQLGFDYQRGRLDVTDHPFCSSMGPNDCRITTRYDERFFSSAFFGILHEAGHGMYDQGLRGDQYGLPTGTYLSLGVHESQSRMWENLVGRSAPFWEHFYPQAQARFPEALGNVSRDDFFFAINAVEPSLIRVEADEATYNLHIIIRFELEQALVSGELSVADLPAAWNEKYRNDLGITPPNDAEGVLQDIHWSAALIGYFPTYTLGNLYASQFYDAADEQLGGLAEMFRAGEFLPLLQWLQTHIHQKGRSCSADQLCRQVTGSGIDHRPLIRQLREKLAPLYKL